MDEGFLRGVRSYPRKSVGFELKYPRKSVMIAGLYHRKSVLLHKVKRMNEEKPWNGRLYNS